MTRKAAEAISSSTAQIEGLAFASLSSASGARIRNALGPPGSALPESSRERVEATAATAHEFRERLSAPRDECQRINAAFAGVVRVSQRDREL